MSWHIGGKTMNNNWFDELKQTITNFIQTSTDDELKNALSNAGYEYYTGKKIADLQIHKHINFIDFSPNITLSFHTHNESSDHFNMTKPLEATSFCDQYTKYMEAA